MKSLIAYHSTIGLNAKHENYKTRKLIKVCFDVYDDDTVKVYAVSAHNLGKLTKITQRTISREQLSELDDDPYDDLVFAREAFSLLDIQL